MPISTLSLETDEPTYISPWSWRTNTKDKLSSGKLPANIDFRSFVSELLSLLSDRRQIANIVMSGVLDKSTETLVGPVIKELTGVSSELLSQTSDRREVARLLNDRRHNSCKASLPYRVLERPLRDLSVDAC